MNTEERHFPLELSHRAVGCLVTVVNPPQLNSFGSQVANNKLKLYTPVSIHIRRNANLCFCIEFAIHYGIQHLHK